MFDSTQDSYIRLRDVVAERTRSLVVWVGSGLSQSASIPTWPGLRAELTKALTHKAAGITDKSHASKVRRTLDTAESESNPWIAFQILREGLGETTYRESVRESLKGDPRAAIPLGYSKVWSLRPSGVLSLNLDRFVARSHSELAPGKALHEFSGNRAGRYVHLLKAPDPFVGNLHGILADESTWVLTNSELKRLRRDKGYQAFVQSCLTMRTILFVGISADDVAAGGHLANLTRLGIDCGTHYWVTSRTDAASDEWAERSHIRVIRYEAPNGTDHSDLIHFFDSLIGYVPPEDPPAPPVSPPRIATKTTSVEGDDALSPEELARLPASDIRAVLNRRARDILATDSQSAYAAYDRFLDQFDEAIYRAWYVSDKDPLKLLDGYRIDKEAARGGFGRLYQASAPDGSTVAIKVMHHDIRRTPGMLQSFRRGVRSMRILSERNVSGMVPYKEAAEIPAYVVMDFINGPDLREAVQTRQITDWHSAVSIMLDVSKIIQSAHGIPERVLHRDIRPSNIMLRNYFPGAAEWEVVVLDFDLSWHRGSLEDTITNHSGTTGYLAPEQVLRSKATSTRSAAVDAYGIGMTIFFVLSGRDPLTLEHRHASWTPEEISTQLPHWPCPWKSIARRLGRLIVNCTRESQSARWDIGQICGELQRVKDAIRDPSLVDSAELLAEEVLARSSLGGYAWNPEKVGGVVALASGLEVCVWGDESARAIHLRVSWSHRGDAERKRVGKWLPATTDKAQAMLRRNGWEVGTVQRGAFDALLDAVVPMGELRRALEPYAKSLGDVSEAFRLP